MALGINCIGTAIDRIYTGDLSLLQYFGNMGAPHLAIVSGAVKGRR